MPNGFSRRKFTMLFVIALAFRLAMAMIPADRNTGDQIQYQELANNLRAHGTFGEGDSPSVHRPPLYPMILAAIGATGTIALQMIAGAAIAPLTFAIASSIVPPMGAMLAGMAMAFAPMSSRYCTLLMTETLFTFLLVLGVFFWTIRKPVMCGICFGFAALLRAVLLPMLVILPLFAIKRAWRSTLIVSVTAVAVIAPWTLRNWVETHRFVPIATAGWGSNLFQGTLDVPTGDPWPFIMQQRAGDMEGALLKRGVNRILQDPVGWLAVRVKQYPKLFLDDSDYLSRAPRAKYFLWIADVALLIFAAIGWSRTRPGPQIWIFPAFTALSQLPMWTEARYSLPMVPFLLIMASEIVWSKDRVHPAAPLYTTDHPSD
jgi:hypothetical protein